MTGLTNMTYRPRRGIVVAWLGLLAADVIIRFAGFHRLCETVRRFPVCAEQVADPALRRTIYSSVDQAACFYFKRVRCLQRSAAATCLLRLFGVPAEMVIAVQMRPFHAHAWVESDGKVLSEGSAVQRHFKVMERC